jgi:hypothetical protein
MSTGTGALPVKRSYASGTWTTLIAIVLAVAFAMVFALTRSAAPADTTSWVQPSIRAPVVRIHPGGPARHREMVRQPQLQTVDRQFGRRG